MIRKNKILTPRQKHCNYIFQKLIDYIYKKKGQIMKFVLNICYGGFSLSNEARILYLEKYKKENNLLDFKIIPLEDRHGEIPYTLVKNNINDLYTLEELFSLPEEDFVHINDRKIDRSDDILIQTIEELGTKKASGICAELHIEDIEKGTIFELLEYDGYERIEYKSSDFLYAYK